MDFDLVRARAEVRNRYFEGAADGSGDVGSDRHGDTANFGAVLGEFNGAFATVLEILVDTGGNAEGLGLTIDVLVSDGACDGGEIVGVFAFELRNFVIWNACVLSVVGFVRLWGGGSV